MAETTPTKDTGAVQQLVSPDAFRLGPPPPLPDYKRLKEAGEKSVRSQEAFKRETERAESEALGKEAKMITDRAAAQEREIAAAQQKLAEQKPYLEPTKENFNDFATMFSVLSALSFAVGGKGRGHGMGALSALNGAVEGWNKGRKDLFDRNMKEFEKQLAAYKNTSEEVYKNLRLGFELGGMRTEAGRAQIKQAQLMDNGVIAARLQAGQDQEALKQAEQNVAQAEKLEIAYNRKKEETAKGIQQRFMAQRSINAPGGVASALENIGILPAGTTTGILPNLQTKDGMINAIRNAAGRKISSKEAQAMEVLFTGVARNLAAIEASGAATGLVGLAVQMEKLIPKPGDTTSTLAIKLSDMRRIAVENIMPLIESGLLSKEQEASARVLVSRIERAIPYTNEDVLNALGRGRKTMVEKGSEYAGGGSDIEKQRRLEELRRKQSGAQ